MNIRFIISVILSSLFLSSFVNAECSYTSRESSCEIFTSPFNSFNLDFIDEKDIESYTVSIHDSFNSKNKLKLDVNYNTDVVRNLNPFTQPGVYVLDVITTNRAGETQAFRKEYLFDNLKPNLPVVPINLDTEMGNVNVLGSALFSSYVAVFDKYGTELKRIEVLADGNYKLNLNLVPGNNFFKFTSVGDNGLMSEFVSRVIVSKLNAVINYNPFVNSISIDDNSDINEIFSSTTLKREFYVSGDIGTPNSRVFISGNPVVSDGSGKFAGFVNLNQGANTIVVLAGDKKSEISINYVSDRFRFTDFSISKFVTAPSVAVSVSALYDAPFDVYLNGEFKSTLETSSGVLSFSLDGLRQGQNYVYLIGPGGDEITKLIYYDNLKPLIDVITPQVASVIENFIFEVSDDFGFDISKTVFKLNGNIISNVDLEVMGNYFSYDVSGLAQGDYSYSVLVYDLAGNFKEVFGSFKISSSSVSINSLESSSGIILGSRIFFDELGNKNIILIPSENIAFENIFLDGEDQTNYRINQDNSVELEIMLTETSGSLDFNFIDSDNNKYSQSFSYKIIGEPDIEIDYVSSPILKSGESFVVSGRVISEYFDWSSFTINGVSGKRYGNYFETFVDLENNNKLIFTGRDYLGNSLSYTFNGVGVDSSDLRIEISEENKVLNFEGSISNFQNKVLNFVTSYDGIYSRQVLPQSFSLSSGQRSGLRSLNLHGEKSSKKDFKYVETVSIDGVSPEIYFLENDIVVLGTLSQVISILVNGVDIGVGDSCSGSNKIGDFCKEISKVSVGDRVQVIDEFSNSFERVYLGNSDLVEKFENDLEFYFTGNDVLVEGKRNFVQGQYVSGSKVTKVSSNYGGCSFDEYNFICMMNLAIGEHHIDVTFETDSGESVDDDIVVIVVPDEDADGSESGDGECTDCDDGGDNIGTGVGSDDDNDNDDDGLDNGVDLDDDNDGIPDDIDIDDDGDGVADVDDLDDDNDGILDTEDPDFVEDTPKFVTLSLEKIYGENIYEILGKYYTDANLLNVEGEISKKVPLKLVINNEEFFVGELDGRINILDVELSDFVAGQDEVNLNVNLRVTDEFDNNINSNKLVLIYNRILDTLVDIIIN